MSNAELNAARIAHSAARRALNSFPIGARPDLEQAERAAWKRVEAAAKATLSLAPKTIPCRYRHCCDKAEHVAGTWYAHETNCPEHRNQTLGTMD